MSLFELSSEEARVLGCLMEKERLTPENYPLSLHGLNTACNQSTNRDPVVAYDEPLLELAIESLREKRLVSVIFGAGARVQKYRHRLPEHFELSGAEMALLCVLLLRGPQTAGELRTRAERMFCFGSLSAVEDCLAGLSRAENGLVEALPTQPGQKEGRYRQLLEVPSAAGAVAQPEFERGPTRIEKLEATVTALQAELVQLREDWTAFRRQFE